MIRVNTREYCDNCMRFEPASMKAVGWSADTIIECTHSDICEHVAEYYRKKAKDEQGV